MSTDIDVKENYEEEQHDRTTEELREIIQRLPDFADNCENLEDIHGYLQALISDSHKKDPDVLNQPIIDHFYIKKQKLHFYVTGTYKDILFGYLVNAYGVLTCSTGTRGKWNRFKCEEDCAVPRTMADVIKEYD